MQLIPTGDKSYAPPEFGIESNILKTITIPLDAARDLKEFEIGGTCLWAQTASDLAASIDVRINDQSRDPLTISQGFFIRGVPFSRIYVTNTAQAGKWIKLLYTVEDVPVQIVNPSSQFDAVTIIGEVELKKQTPTSLLAGLDCSLAASAPTIILAANQNRRIAIIRNLIANTHAIRIGGAVVGATRGIELAPGDSITLETTDTIAAYNTKAEVQFVSVLYSED